MIVCFVYSKYNEKGATCFRISPPYVESSETTMQSSIVL